MRLSWMVCLAVAFAITVGCSREDSASTSTSAASSEPMPPPSPRGPIPASHATLNPSPTVIADSGSTEATLARLTQALRDHVLRTRTVPKNFEEFAAKAQVTFPPPPEGKKYAISDQAVVLVKR